MSASLTADRQFDHLGLESPFAAFAPPASPFGFESEDKPAQGDDPPKLGAMLAIPGRFDDPKRDRAIEMDGTRFSEFLKGRNRREFAAEWLKTRPSRALAAIMSRAA